MSLLYPSPQKNSPLPFYQIKAKALYPVATLSLPIFWVLGLLCAPQNPDTQGEEGRSHEL